MRRLFSVPQLPKSEYLVLLALAAGDTATEKLELMFEFFDLHNKEVLEPAVFEDMVRALVHLALRPPTSTPRPPATADDLINTCMHHLFATDGDGLYRQEDFVTQGPRDPFIATVLDLSLGIHDTRALTEEQRKALASRAVLPPKEVS